MTTRYKLTLFILLTFILPIAEAFSLDSACVPAQDSVDNGLADLVGDSVDNASGCSPSATYGNDIFAVSAGQLASRAIADKACLTTTFTKREKCNKCFRKAKAPLALRFDGTLFHGLLANAVSIIETQRAATCSSLTN